MSIPLSKGRFSIRTISEVEKPDIIIELSHSRNDTESENDLTPLYNSLTPQPLRMQTCFSKKCEKDLTPTEIHISKTHNLNNNQTSILINQNLNLFYFLLNNKYIEMINFHKEEMLDYIKKDTDRQGKIMKLLDEIANFTKENMFLEQENTKLRKFIIENP
ncbi:hypothetical protein SteCoe_30272 [Stentor coeruleus]|uniref:Uncharacterized protein n=1 Tax=Stentor coeruleus TaxID=5963 RepID=A0A1R2B3Z5_9CILI|nr:hypothetical protein SteCoe_30272 [Stentor coeruleus]